MKENGEKEEADRDGVVKRGLVEDESDGSGIRRARVVGRTGAAHYGATGVGGHARRGDIAGAAQERILTFSAVRRASRRRQEGLALRVVARSGDKRAGGEQGCARDGAVASPCRILQYPWLRRLRGFPAKA